MDLRQYELQHSESQPPAKVGGKRGGREMSPVIFTDEQNPQLSRSNCCKHCMLVVTHLKKSERVQTHLFKCSSFVKAMVELDAKDRPDWFNERQPSRRAKMGQPSASVLSQSQTSIKNFNLPRLSKSELQKIEDNLAMHYYITGTSFVRVEEKHLLEAFKISRPDIQLPDRKKLAGAALDRCYRKVKTLADKVVVDPNSMCCLTTDATSNVKTESIVNYMSIFEKHSFFLESVSTGEESYTFKFIAADLLRVIDELQACGVNVAGDVTGNTVANKKAWKILNERFPSLYFHGWTSHGLHLMAKDIFAATKAKRGRIVADYPEGDPFEYMLTFAQDCKDVVSFFSYHQQEKANLIMMQNAANVSELIQPAATRWGTLLQCMVALKNSEAILHQIGNARDFVSGNETQKQSRQKIQDIICHKDFVAKLVKSIEILETIDIGIPLFQSDHVSLSSMYKHFSISMVEAYQTMDGLVGEERSYLLKLCQERLEFMYGDAVGLAFILDPVTLGKGMRTERRIRAENSLFESVEREKIVHNENQDEIAAKKEQLFSEYTQWYIQATANQARNDFRYQMLMKGTNTALQYWLIDGTAFPPVRSAAMKFSAW
jgi:Protein of unknown function (DUF 659)